MNLWSIVSKLLKKKKKSDSINRKVKEKPFEKIINQPNQLIKLLNKKIKNYELRTKN
jgi:nucleotidyltransferase/DNA polymerase involved in DNA repair